MVSKVDLPKFLRSKDVYDQLLRISRSMFHNWLDPKSPYYIADFPKPFRVGEGGKGRAVFWLESEIIAWMEKQALTNRKRDAS